MNNRNKLHSYVHVSSFCLLAVKGYQDWYYQSIQYLIILQQLMIHPGGYNGLSGTMMKLISIINLTYTTQQKDGYSNQI